MSRGRMTMRADTERDQASGTDDYGQPLPPNFQPQLTDEPCWVWSKQRRELEDGRKTAIVEDLRAMFPLGSDVAMGDRITAVKNRRGETLLAGTFSLDTIQRKHRHVEAALERVT